jgi:hypothetical protein
VSRCRRCTRPRSEVRLKKKPVIRKEIDVRGGFERGGGRISGTMDVPTGSRMESASSQVDSVSHPPFYGCAPPIRSAIRTASAPGSGRLSLDLATEGISGSIADRLTLGLVPRKMPIALGRIVKLEEDSLCDCRAQ